MDPNLSIPVFSAVQDNGTVTLRIECPKAKSFDQAHVATEGSIFGFHLPPYYLPLVLPGSVHTPSSIVTGTTVSVTVEKLEKGKKFKGLDKLEPQMVPEDDEPWSGTEDDLAEPTDHRADEIDTIRDALNRENARRRKEGQQAPILPLDFAAQVAAANTSQREADYPDHARDLLALPFPSINPTAISQSRVHRYREGSAKTVRTYGEYNTIVARERKAAAEAEENEKWDESVYLDWFVDEDGDIRELISWQGPVVSSAGASSQGQRSQTTSNEQLVMLGALELLFAWFYDQRTTGGEGNIESCWTMSSLCRSLVWLAPPTAHDGQAIILRASIRRALVFPLYRSWKLCDAVVDDVLNSLTSGPEGVAAILEEMASWFADSNEEAPDTAYEPYERSWISPIAARIKEIDIATLDAFARCVRDERPVVTKDLIGRPLGASGPNEVDWDLELLEQVAQQTLEENRQAA